MISTFPWISFSILFLLATIVVLVYVTIFLRTSPRVLSNSFEYRRADYGFWGAVAQQLPFFLLFSVLCVLASVFFSTAVVVVLRGDLTAENDVPFFGLGRLVIACCILFGFIFHIFFRGTCLKGAESVLDGFSKRKDAAAVKLRKAFELQRQGKFQAVEMEREVSVNYQQYLDREEIITESLEETSSSTFDEGRCLELACFARRHLQSMSEVQSSSVRTLAELLYMHHRYEWDLLVKAKRIVEKVEREEAGPPVLVEAVQEEPKPSHFEYSARQIQTKFEKIAGACTAELMGTIGVSRQLLETKNAIVVSIQNNSELTDDERTELEKQALEKYASMVEAMSPSSGLEDKKKYITKKVLGRVTTIKAVAEMSRLIDEVERENPDFAEACDEARADLKTGEYESWSD